MYDLSKRKECKDIKVREVVEILSTLPEDASVLFNGDNYGYLHIEEDLSIISFDDASLDEEYEKAYIGGREI